jgi:hypothetical protein
MWLPYWLSHHIFNRVQTDRECQNMIKKLAGMARLRQPTRTAQQEEWDALENTKVFLNEPEDQAQQKEYEFSDDERWAPCMLQLLLPQMESTHTSWKPQMRFRGILTGI